MVGTSVRWNCSTESAERKIEAGSLQHLSGVSLLSRSAASLTTIQLRRKSHHDQMRQTQLVPEGRGRPLQRLMAMMRLRVDLSRQTGCQRQVDLSSAMGNPMRSLPMSSCVMRRAVVSAVKKRVTTASEMRRTFHEVESNISY